LEDSVEVLSFTLLLIDLREKHKNLMRGGGGFRRCEGDAGEVK